MSNIGLIISVVLNDSLGWQYLCSQVLKIVASPNSRNIVKEFSIANDADIVLDYIVQYHIRNQLSLVQCLDIV